ncbi:hypothetical protein E3P97_03932 [Wallemia ichthyophaga]|nr:hypothetical protein E3P97_03932 [Wallemia ichthyophaga]
MIQVLRPINNSMIQFLRPINNSMIQFLRPINNSMIQLLRPINNISFGFGGKLVIHNPSTPIASPFTPSTLGMSQPTPSTVNIAELASVLPPDLSPPFPGPLLGNSHTTKSQVLRYLDNKISTGATYPKMALLKVLRVMLIHDGILSSRQSEEIRDALISDDINAHSHKRAPSGLQITVPADETSPHMKPFPSSQTPYAVEDSADIVATYCTTTGHLGAIQQFLVKGAKREAVMYALEHKLWSHALLISSCVDRQLWSEVVSALIAYELPSSSGSGNDNTGSTHNTKNWDSLRVAYGLFAGTLRSTNTPSDTRNWSATAATLVSNLDNSDAQHALSELGDRLAEVGEVDGAHTVYILAQSVDKVRLNLVGCAHNAYSDESCEMSEILEYALSLNPHMKAHVKRGEYSGMPHLQIYKLVHAWHLAEAGRLHDANRYCEAIATSIKMSKQLQYHPNLYIQLKELSDRLAAHLHTADKSWLTKKIARPSLDTLWNSMEGKLTKFIAGNDEEGENAITTHAQKTTQDDPFATFTSIDESSTNGRLSRAVSAFDLPNYSNAAGENAGAGMSEGMSLLDRRASHSPSYLTPGIASGAAGARSALGQPRAASAMGGLGGVATANANTIANGLGNMHNLLRDLPSPMEGEDREGFTRAAVTPPFSDEFNGVGVAQDGEMLGKDLQNVQMPLQTSMQPHPATQQMQPPPPPPPAQMQPPPPPPLAQPVRNVSPAQQQSQSQSQSQLKPHPQPPSSHSQPPPPPAQPAITSPFGHSTSASEDFNAPEELDESEGGNFVSLMDSMDVPIPTTTTENSNANAYISPRVIDEIDEADELEDDLGFGNSSTKKAKEMREKDNEGHHGEEEKTAATYQPPPPPPPAPAPGKQEKSGWFSRSTTPASTPRMDEKMEKEGENKESKGRQEKRPELKQSVSSSWLSRWWKKDEQNTNQGGGPVKAKLGEQSSFYYDPDQKRWVNKANESGSEGGTAASPRMPPPPPRSSTVSPGLAGTRGASALKNSVSMDLKGESGSGSGAGVMPPPPPRPLSTAITGTPAGTPAGTPPTPNAPQPTQPIQRKGKKAARNKYVASSIHNHYHNHGRERKASRMIRRGIPANILPTASPTADSPPPVAQVTQGAQGAQDVQGTPDTPDTLNIQDTPDTQDTPNTQDTQDTQDTQNPVANANSTEQEDNTTESNQNSPETSPSVSPSNKSSSNISPSNTTPSETISPENTSLSTPDNTANIEDSSDSLSGGSIAGICVGIAAFIAILVLISLVIFKKRKRQEKTLQRGSRMQFTGDRGLVGQSNASFGGGPVIPEEITSPTPLDNTVERSSAYIPMPISITQGREATATTQFVPSLPDEIMLIPGDKVHIVREWDDGWCSIHHLAKGMEGVCPKEVLGLTSHADDFADSLSQFNKRLSLYGVQEDVDKRKSSLINAQMAQMLVVGLTGGIATGKSTVTQRLREEHKLRVIDLDSVARQVVEPNTPALRSIADRYGDRVLKWDEPSNQHTLNRPALARILFDDKAEKKWIESVLHPEILKRTAWEVLKAYASLSRVVVLDVPLLFEANLHRYVGVRTLVYSSQDVQLHRLMQRDGISEHDAQKKIAAQLPIDVKVDMADQVVHNDSSREETYREVDGVWLCPPLAAIQAAWAVWWSGRGNQGGVKQE